ncbi:pyridine nucleotide-disulfide oxidoreductase-domain-containing protein [Ilyonectria robusta]|uniref:pyridine nucleotide-disulfide oxidoreductase-domain-containing protein n=1 Tax=Ilyonectria robusta TaxID=1079257 RepID=UPI001E8E9BDE|nr:pyridine nucleotide-disulfide oxidoreductase-domain-containing protein [Ilyonectria robusta]KAH8661801.1 pyridine nucleotide-disulfide oxidoreductase-domain-containing protein [Ilyonectria robusta]
MRLANTEQNPQGTTETSGIEAKVDSEGRKRRERVVVLGSGWAGYALARDLDPAKYERIIISPRSYFVFTPLLASTSVGTLEFRSVLEPIRRLQPDRFHQGWADDIDFANKSIRVETNPDTDETSSRTLPPITQPSPESLQRGSDPSAVTFVETSCSPAAKETLPKYKGEMITIPYDKLILAVGAYSQTFGVPGVREHANFLRDVGDARSIRLRVLQCFERAERPSTTDEQRRKLLHFAVVGGGPTGIEFAAELHDLIHDDLARLYPDLTPFIGITVYDIAPGILPMFDKRLSSYAVDTFRRQGIRVRTEHHLQSIRPDVDGSCGLKLKILEHGDDEVGAGIVVWSTGLMQNPLVAKLVAKEIRSLGTPEEQQQQEQQAWHFVKAKGDGGIITDDHLRVRISAGCAGDGDTKHGDNACPHILPNVYAIGDCAVMERDALPATAQVASQQAKYLAKALNTYGSCEAFGNNAQPFRFRNLGTLAYIGSWRAIAQSSSEGLTGRLAWILWRGAYITRTMSLRNKIMVLVHWFMTWLFGRDISRF